MSKPVTGMKRARSRTTATVLDLASGVTNQKAVEAAARSLLQVPDPVEGATDATVASASAAAATIAPVGLPGSAYEAALSGAHVQILPPAAAHEIEYRRVGAGQCRDVRGPFGIIMHRAPNIVMVADVAEPVRAWLAGCEDVLVTWCADALPPLLQPDAVRCAALQTTCDTMSPNACAVALARLALTRTRWQLHSAAAKPVHPVAATIAHEIEHVWLPLCTSIYAVRPSSRRRQDRPQATMWNAMPADFAPHVSWESQMIRALLTSMPQEAWARAVDALAACVTPSLMAGARKGMSTHNDQGRTCLVLDDAVVRAVIHAAGTRHALTPAQIAATVQTAASVAAMPLSDAALARLAAREGGALPSSGSSSSSAAASCGASSQTSSMKRRHAGGRPLTAESPPNVFPSLWGRTTTPASLCDEYASAPALWSAAAAGTGDDEAARACSGSLTPNLLAVVDPTAAWTFNDFTLNSAPAGASAAADERVLWLDREEEEEHDELEGVTDASHEAFAPPPPLLFPDLAPFVCSDGNVVHTVQQWLSFNRTVGNDHVPEKAAAMPHHMGGRTGLREPLWLTDAQAVCDRATELLEQGTNVHAGAPSVPFLQQQLARHRQLVTLWRHSRLTLPSTHDSAVSDWLRAADAMLHVIQSTVVPPDVPPRYRAVASHLRTYLAALQHSLTALHGQLTKKYELARDLVAVYEEIKRSF